MNSKNFDAEYVASVGQCIEGLIFSDEDLDESLKEISDDLSIALRLPIGGQVIFEPISARIGMAYALGMVAALRNIKDTQPLESIMLESGFICHETDDDDVCAIKGVALDRIFERAIHHERLSLKEDASAQVSMLTELRQRTTEVMKRHGYGLLYYNKKEDAIVL